MSRHKVPLLRKYAVLNLRNTRISNSMFQIAKSSYLDYSSAAVKYAVKKDTNILQTYLNDECSLYRHNVGVFVWEVECKTGLTKSDYLRTFCIVRYSGRISGAVEQRMLWPFHCMDASDDACMM